MKQINVIKMGAYIAEDKPFDGYPKDFNVWNVNHRYDMDFLGSPTTRALTGRERGNPSGQRPVMDINLDNSRTTDTTNVKSLINKVSTQFNRVFFPETGSEPVTIVDATNGNITISNVLSTVNYYNGLSVQNLDETVNNVSRINVFSGTHFLVTGNISNWATNDNVVIIATPDVPTIIGASTDNTNTNISFYNMVGSTLGINRELTVGNQIVSVQLRGTTRIQDVPDNIVI